MKQPDIGTNRLHLRPFLASDARRVQYLAGAKAISDVTANIPHPYQDGMAEEWISTHKGNFESGATITYAITLSDNETLIGCISLINVDSNMPEIGYWLGVDYWGKGYCTEACMALMDFCQTRYQLDAIYGKHLVRNPASGKVLTKCGLVFSAEGLIQEGFMDKKEAFNIYKKCYISKGSSL